MYTDPPALRLCRPAQARTASWTGTAALGSSWTTVNLLGAGLGLWLDVTSLLHAELGLGPVPELELELEPEVEVEPGLVARPLLHPATRTAHAASNHWARDQHRLCTTATSSPVRSRPSSVGAKVLRVKPNRIVGSRPRAHRDASGRKNRYAGENSWARGSSLRPPAYLTKQKGEASLPVVGRDGVARSRGKLQ